LNYFFAATQAFKLLDKYRPETKEAKKLRLKERAQAKAAGKEDAPTKRAPVVRAGINTVTTLGKSFFSLNVTYII
jgi:large subunit ribosomal protein L7Ae